MVSFPQKGQFSNAFLIMDGGVHVQKKILKYNFGKYCQKKPQIITKSLIKEL